VYDLITWSGSEHMDPQAKTIPNSSQSKYKCHFNSWVFLGRAILFSPFGFVVPKYILVFKSYDFERTWWRLFQTCDVWTKLDINSFFYCSR